MKHWIINNWWSLLIALLTISSTYVLYGYRLDQLEKHEDEQDSQILQLQQSNMDTAVSLAKIQKDIEYIRLQIDKIVR